MPFQEAAVPAAKVALTPELLALARQGAARQGVSVLNALALQSGWAPDDLMLALSNGFGYPTRAMQDLHGLSPRFDVIPYPECLQRGVLVAHDPQTRRHWLLLSDPFDADTEAWALRRCRAGLQMAPQIALLQTGDLQAYLALQGRQLRAIHATSTPPIGPSDLDEEVAADITLSGISSDGSAVVKLVNSTIYDALQMRASDIHLECDAGCLRVLYRIDGVLLPVTQVQGHDMAEQVVSRVKVMAELDIAERRVPQDGRFKVRVNGRHIDFRVSVMPNMFGEDAVLRLLDRQALSEQAQSLQLDTLGLDTDAMAAVRRLARMPHGMLLVTGPTGSGKTTTLYGAITEIHTGLEKIITIEDPVEYRLPKVLQIPVNEKKGLTFARGLRSILRHDPDKIMVGEIRDDETAQISVQAALTGHLVFTTLHANNVFDVLGRFLHMGVDAYSFAAALNGIVAQRLLRINCPYCSGDAVPEYETLQLARLSRERIAGWHFRAGRGCANCRGTGFKGRRAIAEVLCLDDTMRELIATQAPVGRLKELAAKAGMRPLVDAAWQCVARGESTPEEVLRVAG